MGAGAVGGVLSGDRGRGEVAQKERERRRALAAGEEEDNVLGDGRVWVHI